MLSGEPEALKNLAAQWSAGDFSGIPQIVLLPSADISGAMGAYAISTGTIYLNAGWLAAASKDQVNAVLTEELGHHLDALLNEVDTPGDEGELFCTILLHENGAISTQERQRLVTENDDGIVDVDRQTISVEQATVISTPIQVNAPGRTNQEWRNQDAFAAIKADGSVITWGNSFSGGDSSTVAGKLDSNVSQIFSNRDAFAALKADGSVVTWGDPSSGGDSSAVAASLVSGVTLISSTKKAFAALKADGSVVT